MKTINLKINCLPSPQDNQSEFNKNEVNRFLKNYKFENQNILHIGKKSLINIGKNIHNNRSVIIKSINKKTTELISQETKTLKKLVHAPGVIRFLDTFNIKNNVSFLVLEQFGNGNLSEYLKINGCVSENTAKIIFKQIVNAVNDCIQFNILHKKIQCNNILINFKTLEIKLIDFNCTTAADFPYIVLKKRNAYVPPEYFKFKRSTTNGIIVWRLGIILYNLLYGKKPFYSSFDILNTPCVLPSSNYLSIDVQNFIEWCLQKNSFERMTFIEMLNHPWITNYWP
jgi:non-specific serine/threonine protein kinase